jgi:hypothetical protein
MYLKNLTGPIFRSALVLAVGFGLLAVALDKGAAPVSASDDRNGQLHITKDCPTYTGAAGGHCTITASNLVEIPAGSFVYYDQAAGVPTIPSTTGTPYLDSNIFLYVGPNDWAVGRCTLNLVDYIGLCTLSDGIGSLAGFTARVNVTYQPGGDGFLFSWDGTYSYNPVPNR